jgi:flagellar protein FliO/FliZ
MHFLELSRVLIQARSRHFIFLAALLSTNVVIAADTAVPPPVAPPSAPLVSTPAVTPPVPTVTPIPATVLPTQPTLLPPPPTATHAALPTLPTSSAATAAVASATGLTQIALVLVIVVGLIAAMAWLMRRLGMARASGGLMLKIVGGISLSNREKILVVEIADQWLVVGVAPGRISTLSTMPKQDTPLTKTGLSLPSGQNFALWLKQTMDKRRANQASNGAATPGSNNGMTRTDKINNG